VGAPGGAGGTEGCVAETVVSDSAAGWVTLVPQRGQNEAPVLSVLPQRMQKAVSISHTI